MGGLTLRIITPEEVVLDETVDSVSVTATDGSMGIHPRHAGMVAALDAKAAHRDGVFHLEDDVTAHAARALPS